MCYFNNDTGGRQSLDTGAWIPYVAPTLIYCDDCAETQIPLPEHGPNGDRVGRHWDTGFKWAPYYGGTTRCCACNKPC